MTRQQLPAGWNHGPKPYDNPSLFNETLDPQGSADEIGPHWQKYMKDVSIPYLEQHVFNPEIPGYSARLHSIGPVDTSQSDLSGKPGASFNLGFHIKHNDQPVGFIDRVLDFTDGSPTMFTNSKFAIFNNHQGKGIGSKIYDKSEKDLYRLLSDHQDSLISMTANISLGAYAWALHGYDWSYPGMPGSKTQVEAMRKLIGHVARTNGITDRTPNLTQKINGVLKNTFDVDDYRDLRHSWQYAMLDDGKRYRISALDGAPNPNGHFGKAFMINFMKEWPAFKPVHDNGEIHHKVADAYRQHKGNYFGQIASIR